MMTVRDCVAMGIVMLFLGMAVQPAVVGEMPDDERSDDLQGRGRDEVPAPFRNMGELASKLLNTTSNNTDTDLDGLPDNVERALGTDPDNNDSDFDRLYDRYEVFNGLDPNEPDSNDDHMPDYLEVTGVPSDLDSDGVPNAWDWDNDNDGVMDDQDYSPFAKTSAASSFHLDINVSDRPTYITFQFRTNDPDHLRLIQQAWNWPDDSKGSVKDLDGSTDDLGMYPMLEFRAEGLPDAEALAEQGIIVSGGAANLPVLPISEFGNIVAFKARMFYPQSASSRHITANVSFSWKVLGKTDTELKALKEAQGSKYLSADAGGNVSAKGSIVGPGEVFDWIEPSGSELVLRASNGICLAPGAGGILSATQDQPSEMMAFSVEPAAGGRIVLKAKNDRYLTVKANGSVAADALLSTGASQFEPVDVGVRPDITPMATYAEDILLTGCRVEEDFGATAGVLYGSNQSLMVMAAIGMDIHFLCNATLGLDSVPEYLKDNYNMTLGHNISSFGTYEEAMIALASSMPKDALGKLPNGTHLPVIMAMEDKCRGIDLSEMSAGGYIKGGQLVADCAIKDVITTRTLKTTWYNTSSDKPMGLAEIAGNIIEWDTTVASIVNLIIMAAAWNAGEQKVVSIGNTSVDYSSELKNINFKMLWLDLATIGADVFGEVFGKIGSCRAGKYELAVLDHSVQNAKMNNLLKYGAPLDDGIEIMNDLDRTQKALTKAARGIGVLEKLGKGLEVLGFLIDLGIAVYSWFVIIDMFGWNLTGVLIATVVASLMISYAIALFVLAGAFPPISTAIALAIGLIDTLIAWIFGTAGSQMLINLIVKYFVKFFMKVHIRTEVDLDMVDATTVINDSDNNGLDVGDNITYTARFFGNVSLTKHGKSKDLEDSYMTPALSSYGPDSAASNYTKVLNTSSTGKQKTTLYETGASVIPGTAMADFPMTVNITTGYKIYYENTWFLIIPDRRSSTGATSSMLTTLYFDVMPDSIADFVNWSPIKSNDRDGDGINNTDENGTSNGTSPWKWDTDADGLGDSYELEIGTDPAKADTDGDGLNDSCEHKLGTNCSSRDTDGDGLSDYAEVSGAVISFSFSGCMTHYHTNSDPTLDDTDGDGVSDPDEYKCLLNPRSQDTDGDGFRDMLADHGSERITLDKALSTPFNGFTKILAMSPDRHIWGYQFKPSSPVNYSIVKYDTNGTIKGIWTVDQNVSDMAFDSRGFLYLLRHNPGEIIKYDSSFNRIGNCSTPVCNTLAIDSNAGIVYVTGYYCITLYKYHLNNLTFMGTMKGPDYYGWHLMRMDVDRDGNLYIPYNSSIYVFARNGTLVLRFGKWGQTNGGEFDMESAVRKCPDGDIVVADTYNGRLQKFSPYGKWRVSYGPKTDMMANDFFDYPDTIALDDEYFYIRGGGPVNNNNIMKLRYRTDVVKVNQTSNFTDTDGDGMSDRDEAAGWNVTVMTSSSGRAPLAYHVASDPNLADTDGDGLSDLDESKSASDARRVDTDGDGSSDRTENVRGTNLSNWDTDGDRLDDGTEPAFGSDPRTNDTDGEGLDDMEEFLMGSNPKIGDSDHDGLDDLSESLLGSDPADPDSDDDIMFDGAERENGTDPNDGDSDGDGLVDGYETLYGADPKDNDTDGDGLVDGFEVDASLDPLSNDTDGDGLTDGFEVAKGLDPFSPDSDGDGVPDSLDTDSSIVLDDDIILVADGEDGLEAFWSSLSREATVVNATAQELIGRYKDEPYIVLVGRPDAQNGTAGALIGALLSGSGETLETMLDATWEHSAVRYGVWAPTQTVVMLSRIEPSDDLKVLGMLKSMKLTVAENSITARYLNARSDFLLQGMDTVRATGSAVQCQLNYIATFNVTVSRHNASNAPANLTYGTGLEPGDRPLDRYLDISLEGGGRGGGGLLNRTLIELYYTAADLDRNGDGDADDPEDINESTLSLYWLDGTSGNWSKLPAGQDGPDEVSLNTTDFELHGTQYQGVIWANVTRLALLGVGGKSTEGNLPATARAGDDVTAYGGDEVLFNGTLSTGNGAIVNFTWTFQYDNRTVVLSGPVASFVFQTPGTYTVTLTVRDSLGLSASDTLNVTVGTRPGGKWRLRVGPVTDDNGTALGGALVNLTVGNESFSNTTDGLGMALFDLGPEHAGKGARLAISKEGYLPVDYSTSITPGHALETNPPPLVKTSPGGNFTLAVGPVKDLAGKAIEGATVTLTAGGKTYSVTTDAQGMARFALPLSLAGKGINVKIEKNGYKVVEYGTAVLAALILEQNPPALEKTAKPVGGGGGQGIPAWVLGLVAAAMILVVLIAALFTRKKPPIAAKDEPEGGEKPNASGEGPKEGPPPVPPIERTAEKLAEAPVPEPLAKEDIGEMRKAGGTKP